MSPRYRQRKLGELKTIKFVLPDSRNHLEAIQFEDYRNEIQDARGLIFDAVILIEAIRIILRSPSPASWPDAKEVWQKQSSTWLRYAGGVLYGADERTAEVDEAYDNGLPRFYADLRREWKRRNRQSGENRERA